MDCIFISLTLDLSNTPCQILNTSSVFITATCVLDIPLTSGETIQRSKFSTLVSSSVTRQKGKSQNWGNKWRKHVKFSEKRTFLTPWLSGAKICSFFSENLRALFSFYLRFEIHLFALLPTSCSLAIRWEFCFANFYEIRRILNNCIFNFAQNLLAAIPFAFPPILSTTPLLWSVAKIFQRYIILVKWSKTFVIYLIHSSNHPYKLSLLFEQFIKAS